MTLTEAVGQLDALDEGLCLCVRRPWTPSAECVLWELDTRLAVPAQVTAAGFAYFLEVPLAREVLGVLGETPTTLDQRVELLIYYAERDAYPDWVNQR